MAGLAGALGGGQRALIHGARALDLGRQGLLDPVAHGPRAEGHRTIPPDTALRSELGAWLIRSGVAVLSF